MIVRELVTVLGFKVEDAPLERFNKSVDGLKKSLGALAAIGTAAAGSIFALTETTADYAKNAARSARAAGLSVEQFQRLAFATGKYGMEVNDLNDTLAQISGKIGEALKGSEDATALFNRLGISADDLRKKNLRQILEDVADGMAGIDSAQTRYDLGGQLLGEEAVRQLMPLLMQGADAMREIGNLGAKRGLFLSEEEIAQAKAYRDAMSALKNSVVGLKRMLGGEAFPIVTEWVDGLMAWYEAHKKLVKSKLTDILKGLANAAKIAAVVFGVLFVTTDAIIELLGGYEVVITAVTVGLVAYAAAAAWSAIQSVFAALGITSFTAAVTAAQVMLVSFIIDVAAAGGILQWFGNTAFVAWIKAALPIAAVIAGILAVILILEDLVAWSEGKDSIFGRMFPDLAYEQIKEKIKWIMIALGAVIGLVALIAGGWVIAVVAAIGAAIGMIVTMWDEIVDFFKHLGGWVAATFILLGLKIAKNLATWFEPLTDAWETAKTKIKKSFWEMVGTLKEWGGEIMEPFEKITGGAKKAFDFFTSWGDDEKTGAQMAGAYVGGGAAGPAIDARRRVNQVRNSQANTTRVGQVSVNITGSANMTEDQLARATQAGVDEALKRHVQNASEAYDGGEDY